MESVHIIAHRKEILFSHYEITYEWDGDISTPVYLDFYDPKDLPWSLKFLETTAYGDKYIRTDVKFWWSTYLKIKIGHIFSWINKRLILTAHVWGLVRVYPGEIASWKHAFLNKWKNANR